MHRIVGEILGTILKSDSQGINYSLYCLESQISRVFASNSNFCLTNENCFTTVCAIN